MEYVDDFTAGDVLTFYNVVTMNDGRIYPDTAMRRVNTDNNGLNIDNTGFYLGTTSSFSPGFNAYIACPSDPSIWEGTYTASLYRFDGGFGFCSFFDCDVEETAKITSEFTTFEPFKYRTTTHDVGLWASWDPTVGIRPGFFYDLCGEPRLLPSSTGYGDHEAVEGSYRDEETGIIYMEWCNFLNPVCGTTRFVPIED